MAEKREMLVLGYHCHPPRSPIHPSKGSIMTRIFLPREEFHAQETP